MIKNLFFDLDNTIIKDEDVDSEYYKIALNKLGYDENDYWGIYCKIDEYEKTLTIENNYFTKEGLINFINKGLNRNYSIELIDELIKVVGKTWTKRIVLNKETLEYLYKKYNLYIYTNFFLESQQTRIDEIGYTKYFNKIFTADIYGSKPFKNSFEKILEELNVLPEECIMIGDNKKIDIMAANNVGMKSILYDYDGTRDKKYIMTKDYIVIKDLRELENIL